MPSLGVCRLAWREDISTAATSAADLGFDHIDLIGKDDAGTRLALPVGVHLGPGPGRGWAWTAPPAGADWEDEMARLRAVPHPRVEPWAGSLLGSDAAVHRALAEVPGLRLVVDTGHVTQWDGDVLALLPHADHVQLRQAAPGRGQLPADQGEVDLAAVIGTLAALGYPGLLTVEYFDFPRMGWPLADPPAEAAALAAVVRPLIEEASWSR